MTGSAPPQRNLSDSDEEVPMTDESTDLDAAAGGRTEPEESQEPGPDAAESPDLDTFADAAVDHRPVVGVLTRQHRRSRRFDRKSKFARRLSGTLAMLFALITMGFAYEAFLPLHLQTPPPTTPQVAEGQQPLPDLVHHLPRRQSAGRHSAAGPSLIGVGQAAVYFQVSTGRMPADANGAQKPRKQPRVQRGPDRRPGRVRRSPTAAARRFRPCIGRHAAERRNDVGQGR